MHLVRAEVGMVSESEVREKLAAVFRGALSLPEFQKWLMPQSHNMHGHSSPAAIDLVESLHLLFGEYAHGEWLENQLRRELQRLLDNIEVSIAIGGNGISRSPLVQSGSTISPQVVAWSLSAA